MKLFHGLQLEKWVLEAQRKNTPFAAQTAAEDAAKIAFDAGVKKN